MKKTILIINLIFSFTIANSQTAQELIQKMLMSLSKLKTFECELISNRKYTLNNTFNYNVKATIIFDTIAKNKPLIKNIEYEMIMKYDTNTVDKKLIYSPKTLITINRSSKELQINNYISDTEAHLFDFESDIAPFFYYEDIKYYDSLFSNTYIDESVDKSKLKFEVTSDTACLSGDCFMIKISAPSLLAIGGVDDSTQMEVIYDFKDDITSFWLNKNSFFPERIRKEKTFINGISPDYEDWRFTNIKVNSKIKNDVFKFDRNQFKAYRIEEWKSKSKLITTQQAFVKAPNLIGITQNNDSINLYKCNSKIYIIDFWFVNCPSCMAANKFIETEILPNYRFNEVMVIGVNPIDKSFKKVNDLLKENQPKYPYIINKNAAIQYHLSAYPGIYILNSKFEVIDSYNIFNESIKEKTLKIIKSQLR